MARLPGALSAQSFERFTGRLPETHGQPKGSQLGSAILYVVRQAPIPRRAIPRLGVLSMPERRFSGTHVSQKGLHLRQARVFVEERAQLFRRWEDFSMFFVTEAAILVVPTPFLFRLPAQCPSGDRQMRFRALGGFSLAAACEDGGEDQQESREPAHSCILSQTNPADLSLAR
jgi:hypothetical protein